MPRRAHYMLRWSSQSQHYEITAGGHPLAPNLIPGSSAWFEWLENISSFAFHSQTQASCTVRKEAIQQSGTYWYAYRFVHGRTIKRYLGKSNDLSITRLEEIALRFRDVSTAKKAALEEQEHTSTRTSLPLLTSRLYPPRLSPLLIDRPRLLTRLDAGSGHKLILLQAPAGFGKTTIVNQWIARLRRNKQVAWISLESSDNDLLFFWRYIIKACQTFEKTIGQTALVDLTSTLPSFEMAPMAPTLTLLLNDLARHLPDGLLVLDDYHLIEEASIHETLAFFIDHLPPTLHLLLISRREPPLPLLRWRALGITHELLATDLRFSAQETTTFLEQTLSVPVSETMLRQLDRYLEGWGTGLRLLALTLQGQKTTHTIEQSLLSLGKSSAPTPAQQPLLDYFVTEILDAQSEELQLFLLQTSILSRLTGPLCDTITGRNDGTLLLERVEQAGLFLEAIDGIRLWYRYHALWASALRREATQRLDKEEISALSLRASLWYEQHTLPVEAIEAAFLAGDPERAALLIEQLFDREMIQETSLLRRWLEQLPDTVLQTHPELCLASAMTLRFPEEGLDEIAIHEAAMARIDVLQQMAEKHWQELGDTISPGRFYGFRALSFWKPEPLTRAVEYAQKTLETLPSDPTDRSTQVWRGISLAIVGRKHAYEGWLEKAYHYHQEARTCSQIDGNLKFKRGMTLLLAWQCLGLGELQQAAEFFHWALAHNKTPTNIQDRIGTLLGLAQLSIERYDLVATEQYTHEVSELTPHLDQAQVAHVAIIFALLQYARGKTALAQQQFTALLAQIHTEPLTIIMEVFPYLLIHHIPILLEIGNLQSAQRHRETLNRYEPFLDFTQKIMLKVIHARILLAQGNINEARQQLTALLIPVQERQLTPQLIEILVLLALTEAASNEEQQAQQWLLQAISQAHSEGFLWVFLREKAPMARLIQSLIPTIREKTLRLYAQTILRAFAENNDPLTTPIKIFEPLSPQERRVLTLLAMGYTNPEIAQDLIISVNTVKDHVKHLYRKLGVHNRLQASDTARRFQLI